MMSVLRGLYDKLGFEEVARVARHLVSLVVALRPNKRVQPTAAARRLTPGRYADGLGSAGGRVVMSIEVRELRKGEGLVWRDLRLEALAESPEAFGSTYQASTQRSEEDWHQMVDATSSDPRATSVVAVVEGEPCGMARCQIDEHDSSTAGLFAMWVKPDLRRRGVARQIVEFAFSWMRSRGASFVELAVNEENERAIAFYLCVGFVDTGRREPLRSGSPVQEVVMRRSLARVE